MKIAIVDYNAGNVQSVLYALQRLGVHASVTSNHEEIISAEKVIFPGVGNAGSAMKFLRDKQLHTLIASLTQPVLGICLGLQLMCQHSEEEDTDCLGIFDVNVRRFENNQSSATNGTQKIPHMGWNTISHLRSRLFTGIEENSFVYNVHSFYAEKCNDTIATTNYIVPYSAALHKCNFYGVQFHAEKSAAAGEKIISNFLNLS